MPTSFESLISYGNKPTGSTPKRCASCFSAAAKPPFCAGSEAGAGAEERTCVEGGTAVQRSMPEIYAVM